MNGSTSSNTWGWIKTRATEPSTWAGISGFALMALTQLSPLPASVRAALLGFAGVSAGLSVVMSEKGSKPLDAVIADGLNAAEQIEKKGS